MTGETLKQANALTEQIIDLKKHKGQVMEYTDDLKSIKIGVNWAKNPNYYERLRPYLFVIAADRQMQFYIDEVDKMIAKLEAELAAL